MMTALPSGQPALDRQATPKDPPTVPQTALVARGADVNVANQLLGTPLHVAAGAGKEAMVLLLLEHGASLTVARGSDGYTPLHGAAQAGRTRVVRVLLDRGADVNLLSHGRVEAPALHLAEARGRTEVAQMLREAGETAPAVEPISTLVAAASAERGKVVAGNCTSCHPADPEGKRDGPMLWGIFGRAPASLPGFKYSSALQRLGGVWNEEALNAFVAHPMATVPGASMQFEGLADAEERGPDRVPAHAGRCPFAGAAVAGRSCRVGD